MTSFKEKIYPDKNLNVFFIDEEMFGWNDSTKCFTQVDSKACYTETCVSQDQYIQVSNDG
jgi:hypothetical protein